MAVAKKGLLHKESFSYFVQQKRIKRNRLKNNGAMIWLNFSLTKKGLEQKDSFRASPLYFLY